MSIRTQRIAALLMRELGTILRFESNDTRFASVTLTDLQVTSDLGLAKVYFVVDGDEKTVKLVGKALNQAQGFFRSRLGERIEMRFVPELRFFFDEKVLEEERLERLLKDIRDEKKS